MVFNALYLMALLFEDTSVFPGVASPLNVLIFGVPNFSPAVSMLEVTNIPLCLRGPVGYCTGFLGPHPLPLGGQLPHHPCQHQLHLQGPATSLRVTQVGVLSPPSLLFPAGVLPMLPLVGHHQGPSWPVGVVTRAPGVHLGETGKLPPHLESPPEHQRDIYPLRPHTPLPVHL